MTALELFFLLFAGVSIVSGWNISLSPSEERLQNRRAGDNFLVICKVKDFEGAASDVKIEWFKEGKQIPKFGSTMTIERTYSNQLMINRPKTNDGGKYTCKAEIYGETQEISAEISFVDPPKFVNPQTEQHPVEGSRASIICQVEGTDQLEVFWQFNGVTLDDASQRGYEFSEDKQTLFIPHFNAKKDDGIYNCNAAQYSSFETLSINVTGYAQPTITVFDVPNGSAFEGHTIELKCGAVGKPKPSYKWYFEDDLNPIDHSDKHNVEDGLLIIEFLNEDDAGTYKCVANNTVGSDERTVQLAVFLKPKVEIATEIVKKEGEDVEIICNYRGEGQLAAKFVYGSQEFTVRDEKPIETIEETTIAEISDETSIEDVEPHEETAVLPTDENDEIEESRKWKRFVDDVNNERIAVRAEDNKLILTVRQLSLDDAGNYKCVVSNEAGATERISDVKIIHPPTLRHYSGPSVRSFDGDTLSIFCDVSAVPAPKWKWFKDGAEIEANGATIKIDSEGTLSKLTLVHNEGSDNYGRYKCSADNSVGIFEKEIEVVHVVRPAVPTGMDCKKFMYPNYGKCFFDEEAYSEESGKPLKIEFLIAKLEETESDFNWNDALSVIVDFDNDTIIPDLTPSTLYMVRARASNEAGSSEYSEETSLETTDPWAPQAPKSVKMECSKNCIISWTPGNDHGSPILKYRITIQQLNPAPQNHISGKETESFSSTTKSGEIELTTEEEQASEETSSVEIETEEPVQSHHENNDMTPITTKDEDEVAELGGPLIIEVGADETELQLTHIKPHSYYRVAVAAINEIGQGEFLQIEHRTDESPTNFEQDIARSTLLIAGGIGFLFLFLVVDFICFLTNRCGVIACICLNYCDKSAPRRDVEAGKGPETNRLLDNSGTR
ncbi:unnamed protein product [Caenorhabditis bovis]|uniref:Uncharacterized protein n=1 Tax=Caenorhabditis bovis TaxID=2654633 RepID=A0A8S1EHI0_9PELO|nr:unnamed protein product [Caenorhabditis bovis]